MEELAYFRLATFRYVSPEEILRITKYINIYLYRSLLIWTLTRLGDQKSRKTPGKRAKTRELG